MNIAGRNEEVIVKNQVTYFNATTVVSDYCRENLYLPKTHWLPKLNVIFIIPRFIVTAQNVL